MQCEQPAQQQRRHRADGQVGEVDGRARRDHRGVDRHDEQRHRQQHQPVDHGRQHQHAEHRRHAAQRTAQPAVLPHRLHPRCAEEQRLPGFGACGLQRRRIGGGVMPAQALGAAFEQHPGRSTVGQEQAGQQPAVDLCRAQPRLVGIEAQPRHAVAQTGDVQRVLEIGEGLGHLTRRTVPAQRLQQGRHARCQVGALREAARGHLLHAGPGRGRLLVGGSARPGQDGVLGGLRGGGGGNGDRGLSRTLRHRGRLGAFVQLAVLEQHPAAGQPLQRRTVGDDHEGGLPTPLLDEAPQGGVAFAVDGHVGRVHQHHRGVPCQRARHRNALAMPVRQAVGRGLTDRCVPAARHPGDEALQAELASHLQRAVRQAGVEAGDVLQHRAAEDLRIGRDVGQ